MSAAASRWRAVRLCGHDGAHLLGLRPLRATTRSTWVSGEQSTTSTRSTCARQRPDSTSSGMSNTMQARAGIQRRLDLARAFQAHQRMNDVFELLARLRVGVGVLAHAGAVEGAFGRDEVGAESLRRWLRWPRRPAAVVPREMASASITAAPSCASICSTVLLPLPMPPVRPTADGRMALKVRSRCRIDVRAEDHGREAGAGQERAEGHVAAFAQPAGKLQRDADHGADDRGHQDDRHQRLPAEPGAERGEQLEVAVAHAFLAGGSLKAW